MQLNIKNIITKLRSPRELIKKLFLFLKENLKPWLKGNWKALGLVSWMLIITLLLIHTADTTYIIGRQFSGQGGYGSVGYKLDNIKSGVSTTKSEVYGIWNKAVDIESEVNNIKSKVNEISSIKSELSNIKQEISNIQNTVNKTDASVIKSELSNIKQEISNIQNTVNKTDTSVNGNSFFGTGGLLELTKDIKHEVDDIKSEVDDIKSEVGYIRSKVGYIYLK